MPYYSSSNKFLFILSILITFISCTFSETQYPEDPPILDDINQWCDTVPHPEPCKFFMTEQKLKPPKEKTEFRKMIVEVALERAIHAQSHIWGWGIRCDDHKKRAAWADCVRLYDHTIIQLNYTLNGLTSNSSFTDFDAQTWLSAALTNLETCLGGWSEDMNVTTFIWPHVSYNVSDLISNSLAVNEGLIQAADNSTSDNSTTDGYPSWLSHHDRRLLLGNGGRSLAVKKAMFVVSRGPSARYKTIQSAIDAAARSNVRGRKVIHVGPYNNDITFIGDGIRKTVITGGRSVRSGYTTSNSATAVSGFIGGGVSQTPTFSSPVVEKWYTQPLDHFVVGSDTTFQQRVFVDTSYRQGKPVEDGTPILAFFGGEASIEAWLGGGGIVTLVASRFQAIVVYIEHRFYGDSVPLGSIDGAMMDPRIRDCLTSPQALADFANVLVSLKTEMMIPHSPIIVFGGFYSGMLAAYFRMKYPEIADGALASSAPILGSADPGQQYCAIVSRDFASENLVCYGYISESWRQIDEIAAQPGGLDTLSQTFSTCAPLSTIYELKQFLALVYNYAAQYDKPDGLIGQLCKNITDASRDDILRGIGYAVLSFTQQQTCNNITLTSAGPSFLVPDIASRKAWDWQVCTELVTRQGCDEFTMFERSAFNVSMFMETCFATFGTFSSPTSTSTYYGGQDLKRALRRSASNIIFSNGLMDPYSGASILEDISDTVIAITTEEGSHCLDLKPPQKNDPKWLKRQREKELKIVGRWIESAKSSGHKLPSDRKYVFFLVILAVNLLV